MTTQQAVETIKMRFPETPQTKIYIDLSDAQETFIEDTGLTEVTEDLAINTALSYDLPTECMFVKTVDVYDAEGNPLDTLSYEIKNGKIYFTVQDSPTDSVLPGDVDSISICYVPEPTEINEKTDNFAVEPRYVRAITFLVLQRYAADAGDMNTAAYFEREYMKMVRRGKQFARNRQDETHI